jgi:hypothetical protein
MLNDMIVDAVRQIIEENPDHKATPCMVVEAAKDETSPLHSYFCWDDTEAAKRYRLDQARHLIASIEIISDPQEKKTVAFVSLMADRKNGGGYRDVRSVLSSEELRAELLRTAVTELRAPSLESPVISRHRTVPAASPFHVALFRREA